jgi:serine/threonine protein kinase
MDARAGGPPKTIGRFRVESLLGVGGMGEVYKAVDPTLQRTVAIKTVRPDIDRPEYLERLYREAQACARLTHPNIVTVFEAGEIDGVVYIAMEYLKGDDLASVLRRRELSFEAKVRILLQVLDALHHAHNEDVIHRDIKPSNVYRQLDGSIKLVDFGLARMLRAETLTLSGAVMGTPHYASPEQLKGEHVDKRTDIYSVGALAYEMFAGRRPFQTDYDSVATIVLKVISEPTPPMNVSLSRAFPDIERIVGKAMSKLPADRYQTAAEMRDDLAAFHERSRDAISTVEIELNSAAQATVDEATSLLASGRKDEAQTLLTSALKTNPDARAVGALLDSTRLPAAAGATVAIHRDLSPMPRGLGQPATPAPAAAAPPTAAPPPGAPPTGAPPPAAAATMAAAAAPDAAFDARTSVLPRAMDTAPAAGTPRSSFKVMWWIGGAAAAALIVAAVLVSQPADPSVSSPSSLAAPTAATDTATPAPPAPATATPSTATVTPSSGPAVATAPTATTPAANPPAAPAPPAAPSAGALANNRPTPPLPVPPAATTPPAAAAVPAAVETPLTAKQIFYNEGKGGGVNAGLRFRIIQQVADGGESDVDPGKTFRSGDRVRFAFESNIDGFLYVVQQGSSGNWTVLFPNPDINGGRNQIKKGEQYNVPDEAWFTFDNNPGTENVFVFLSKEAVSVLPGFNRPVTRMESVRSAVVDDLQRSIRSRDLIFERERPAAGAKPSQSTFVVNREEVGKAVSAVIQLVHGQ